MLTLSRTGQVALFALNFLSKHAGRAVTAQEIADAGSMTRDLVVRALQTLRRHGAVRATPGLGFELARPASSVTLLEVLEALNGPLHNLCLMGNDDCRLASSCALWAYCQGTRDYIRSMLSKITVDELPADARGVPVCFERRDLKPHWNEGSKP